MLYSRFPVLDLMQGSITVKTLCGHVRRVGLCHSLFQGQHKDKTKTTQEQQRRHQDNTKTTTTQHENNTKTTQEHKDNTKTTKGQRNDNTRTTKSRHKRNTKTTQLQIVLVWCLAIERLRSQLSKPRKRWAESRGLEER